MGMRRFRTGGTPRIGRRSSGSRINAFYDVQGYDGDIWMSMGSPDEGEGYTSESAAQARKRQLKRMNPRMRFRVLKVTQVGG